MKKFNILLLIGMVFLFLIPSVIADTSAPNVSSLTLNFTIGNLQSTTNLTIDNITAYANVSDNAVDNITVMYIWYENANPLQLLYLPFEGESNTTNTTDFSRFNRNLNVTSVTWDRLGGFDQRGAYNFTGANYIDMGDLNAVDGATQLTYSLWAKFNTLTDFDGLVSKQSTTTSRLQLILGGSGLGDNNDVAITVGNGANTFGYTTSNFVRTNVWYHMVMVYNGSADNNSEKLKFYVNGTLQTLSFSAGTIPTTSPSNAANLTIGLQTTNGMDGSLDEVQIWNISLTSGQINALYINNTHIIDDTMTTKGDNWSVCVTPVNRTVFGSTTCSANITVLNAGPNITNFTLNFTVGETNSAQNITSDNITANVTATDADSDNVKLTYIWYKNAQSP